MIRAHTNAPKDPEIATTIIGRLKKAVTSAITVPTAEVTTLPVEKKIAGKVIAESTAYGI